MEMKPHIRVLGIDDGPFTFQRKICAFAGVLLRLPSYVEGVAFGSVGVDGTDSTEKIADMLGQNRWANLLHAILIDGAALAGFNLVDIDRLYENTGVSVITVTADRPNMEAIKAALLSHFEEWQERYDMLASREIHKITAGDGTLYISFSGTDLKGAKEVVRASILRGHTPEPLRLAHMMVRAFSRGGVSNTRS